VARKSAMQNIAFLPCAVQNHESLAKQRINDSVKFVDVVHKNSEQMSTAHAGIPCTFVLNKL